MCKILAISGGIDSVVMLHQFSNDKEAVVAHFDHGIRKNSSKDAIFVEKLAKKYRLPFEIGRASLGKNCSEAFARKKRYDFLRSVAKKYQGQIYTAHHLDDLLESAIINLVRGTGWRGLAPIDDPTIIRPLISTSKKDIYRYAARHALSFRQDPTNLSSDYLRNRIRQYLISNPINTADLRNIIAQQKQLKTQIDQIINTILPEDGIYQRDHFKQLDTNIALEILRAALLRVGIPATRPQLQDFLHAIQSYAPNKYFNLSKDRLLLIQKHSFVLK